MPLFVSSLWFTASLSLAVMYAMCWFRGRLFAHLKNNGNIEIGSLSPAPSKLPSFKIGVTSAVFQSLGKVLVVTEAFIIEVIEEIITGIESLMTRVGNSLSINHSVFTLWYSV